MVASSSPSFADLLDEMMAEAGREHDGASLQPTLDYLAVAEELHSGRITIDAKRAASAYGEYLEERKAAEPEPMPSIEPDDIARELGLKQRQRAEELDRARREFAKHNHPDRVPEHLRARAIIRMQVANMLIDEAKNRRVKPQKV